MTEFLYLSKLALAIFFFSNVAIADAQEIPPFQSIKITYRILEVFPGFGSVDIDTGTRLESIDFASQKARSEERIKSYRKNLEKHEKLDESIDSLLSSPKESSFREGTHEVTIYDGAHLHLVDLNKRRVLNQEVGERQFWPSADPKGYKASGKTHIAGKECLKYSTEDSSICLWKGLLLYKKTKGAIFEGSYTIEEATTIEENPRLDASLFIPPKDFETESAVDKLERYKSKHPRLKNSLDRFQNVLESLDSGK